MKNRYLIHAIFICIFVLYMLTAVFIAKGPILIWLALLILLLKGYGFARGLYIGACTADILIYGSFLIAWLPNAYRSHAVDNLSAYLTLFIVRIVLALSALIVIVLTWEYIPSKEYMEWRNAKKKSR